MVESSQVKLSNHIVVDCPMDARILFFVYSFGGSGESDERGVFLGDESLQTQIIRHGIRDKKTGNNREQSGDWRYQCADVANSKDGYQEWRQEKAKSKKEFFFIKADHLHEYHVTFSVMRCQAHIGFLGVRESGVLTIRGRAC